MEPNVFEIEVRTEEEEQGRGMLMAPGARVELVFKVDEIRVERRDDDDEGGEEKHEDLGEKVEEELKEVGHEVKEEVREAGEEVKEKVEEARDVVREVAGEIGKGVGEVVEDVGKVEKRVGRFLERAVGIGDDIKREGAKTEKKGEKIEREGQERVIDAEEDKERLAEEELAEEVKEAEEEERKRRPKLGKSIHRLGLNYVGYDHEEKVIVVYAFAGHIPVRELATFFVYDEQADLPNMPHAELRNVTTSEQFLALWFHTEHPVILPQQVRVVRTFVNQQSQELTLRAIPPPGQTSSWYWALEPPAGVDELKLVPGELLAVIFNTNEIGVAREGNAWPLTEVMKATPFSCVGYDGNHTVILYHQVNFTGSRSEEREPPTGKLAVNQPPAAGSAPPAPALPFVTVSPIQSNRGPDGSTEAQIELWFHLSADPADNRVGFAENLAVEALLEDGREMRMVPVGATAPERRRHNVYTSIVTLPPPEQEQRFYYLRLRFPLDANEVRERGERVLHATLRDYINATGIRFEGYNGNDSILAYVRAVVPPPNTSRAAQSGR